MEKYPRQYQVITGIEQVDDELAVGSQVFTYTDKRLPLRFRSQQILERPERDENESKLPTQLKLAHISVVEL